MKVYRYVSKNELNYILNGQYEKLGTICYGEDLSNTHLYKKDQRYIHFFKNKKSIEYIHKVFRGQDLYVCTFNIPVSVLIKSVGLGKYDVGRGYDNNTVTLIEFAVEVNKFRKEWLIDYSMYGLESENIR